MRIGVYQLHYQRVSPPPPPSWPPTPQLGSLRHLVLGLASSQQVVYKASDVGLIWVKPAARALAPTCLSRAQHGMDLAGWSCAVRMRY